VAKEKGRENRESGITLAHRRQRCNLKQRELWKRMLRVAIELYAQAF